MNMKALVNGLLLMPLLSANPAFCGEPDWHYDTQEHWGALEDSDPALPVPLKYHYAVCGLSQYQSPVELSGRKREKKLDTLTFRYTQFAADLVNNGHAVQEVPAEGEDYRGKLKIGPQDYPLIQIHFHTPSEHVVDGRHYPAELHFVHIRDDGRAAVVGVLFETGDKPNKTLQTIIDNTPSAPGHKSTDVIVNPNDLLPAQLKPYYAYAGSLTTPPCREGFEWFVLARPISATARQIAQLRALEHDNHRDPQPLNERTVAGR